MSSDTVSNTKKFDWVGLALAVCGIAASLCLCARFSLHHSVAQLFVFAMYCAIVVLDALFIKGLVGREKLEVSMLLKLIGASVVAGLLLEGLTVLGSPASSFMNPADWSKRRIVVFIVASFIVAQYVYLKVGARGERRAGDSDLKETCRKRALLAAFVLLVCVVVVFRIGARFPYVFYGLAGLALVVVVLLFIRKTVSLPATFFLVALISGSVIMYALPVTTGLSWDDQIHYENASASSYLLQNQFTDTDWNFVHEASDRALGYSVTSVDVFDLQAIEAHDTALNLSRAEDIADGRVSVDKTNESIFEINRIGYLPMAFGLWLGRLVHLNFDSMVMLAKLCNLLAYAGVIAVAISIAPSKKGLFAFVGLLPTSVWQAANFSYDPWLISFVMLGFAYYLRYAWGEQEDFNKRNVALAFAFTFAGLAVKAVYFPVIGLFFLVPKERFASSSQRRRYNAAVFCLGLFTFSSFALPYLFTSGSASTDNRGGSDVDSGKQLAFILSDPLGYMGILGRFLFGEYFAPVNSASFAFDFAYLENLERFVPVGLVKGFVDVAPAGALAIIGVSANDETSARHVSIGASVWAVFLTVFTFALVATALYLSFTPVGLGTVNGCQFRYILPMLVPALAIILNNKWIAWGDKRAWQSACLVAAALSCVVCFVLLILARFV